MTDTERIELKIEQKLKPLITDTAQRQQVTREINALAQLLISAYKAKNHDKRQTITSQPTQCPVGRS